MSGALDWMAWTPATAAFFCAIAFALLCMTLWELRAPSSPRRGFLPLITQRGDRFFISLLTAAYLHIGFIATTDIPVWWVSVGCILSTLVIMRWG